MCELTREEEKCFDYILDIEEQISDLKKGQTKEIKCPKCKGKMFVQKSAYNGHIFAKCETENCITIIQ